MVLSICDNENRWVTMLDVGRRYYARIFNSDAIQQRIDVRRLKIGNAVFEIVDFKTYVQAKHVIDTIKECNARINVSVVVARCGGESYRRILQACFRGFSGRLATYSCNSSSKTKFFRPCFTKRGK